MNENATHRAIAERIVSKMYETNKREEAVCAIITAFNEAHDQTVEQCIESLRKSANNSNPTGCSYYHAAADALEHLKVQKYDTNPKHLSVDGMVTYKMDDGKLSMTTVTHINANEKEWHTYDDQKFGFNRIVHIHPHSAY